MRLVKWSSLLCQHTSHLVVNPYAITPLDALVSCTRSIFTQHGRPLGYWVNINSDVNMNENISSDNDSHMFPWFVTFSG